MKVELDDAMRTRIAAAIAALQPEPIGHINYEGIRHNALPVMGTIGEVWLLREDGTLWRSDADWGLEIEPLSSELHATALVAGSQRYPWLAALVPNRPSNAITCQSCSGRGMLGSSGSVFCSTCGALGWAET